jgi:histidine triad (HIT) family protein
MTLFEKIIARQIPASIEYEDERVIAIRDISPAAPIHVLIIPKRPIAGIHEAKPEDAELLGNLLIIAKKLAEEKGISASGYRLVINSGQDAGQTVDHLHVHLMGGEDLGPLRSRH